jgi:hypothetical protein
MLCVLIGAAPFVPRPHLIEKLSMLSQGQLTAPLDIFDLFFHSWPFALLLAKVYYQLHHRKEK